MIEKHSIDEKKNDIDIQEMKQSLGLINNIPDNMMNNIVQNINHSNQYQKNFNKNIRHLDVNNYYNRNIMSYNNSLYTRVSYTSLCKPRNKLGPDQLKVLEKVFTTVIKPDKALRQRLAEELCMNQRQVQIWFQNRRAKIKRQATNNISDRPSLPNSTKEYQENNYRMHDPTNNLLFSQFNDRNDAFCPNDNWYFQDNGNWISYQQDENYYTYKTYNNYMDIPQRQPTYDNVFPKKDNVDNNEENNSFEVKNYKN